MKIKMTLQPVRTIITFSQQSERGHSQKYLTIVVSISAEMAIQTQEQKPLHSLSLLSPFVKKKSQRLNPDSPDEDKTFEK